MKPLVAFPDAQLVTLAVLRGHVAEGDLLEGVTFGTKPLDLKTVPPIPLPYVAVAIDATSGGWPVVQVATIRVSVWTTTEAEGLRLAQRVRAVLLAYMGDDAVRSYGELTAPVPTTDPDHGGPLAYFTVAARLRPVTL